MKFRFKVQPYQTEAVEAIVGCFAGQPRSAGVSYTVDPGRPRPGQPAEFAFEPSSGFRNEPISIREEDILDNIRRVQKSARLRPSSKLERSKAAQTAPNLDVEMETGTGKTYVYIKTMLEMHQRYGWSKFIVVVPSVAIREGVMKSFDITAEHFMEHYGHRPRAFIYDSSPTGLREVESFSSNAGIQVMIINIQAFVSSGKDNRRIYDELDDFQSRRPIDVISANRPIVILDEPQRMSAKVTQESLSRFRPLMVLRYSATHRVEHNRVHRLDAVDAYNKKLVKRIAVRGITVRGLAGTNAYLYLDGIELSRNAPPRARVELEVQSASGDIRRKTVRVDKGTRLHDISGRLEAYRDLVVTDIDAKRDVLELSNGDVVVAGQLAGRDVTEDSKRRIQIREVIKAHLDKERQLYAQGIKVLSLFFIDEVVKYRDYDREDVLGDYARVFEEEYHQAVGDVLAQLPLDDGVEEYRAYLERDPVGAVHEGYFSIDRKTSHLVNPKIARSGGDKGLATDTAAYDLILKDKERLLSLKEPVRFLFSHSALREGWDNPNVFVIGMLKKSDNTVSRRQEIGRGLRLAVDQDGERIDNQATVHEINELTVVTDESYTAFVDALQKEIAESLSARPRKAKPEYFVSKVLELPDGGGQHEITEDEAKQLHYWLVQHGFIDYEHHLTETWHGRADVNMAPMPAGLDRFHYQVAELIEALDLDIPTPADGRKPKPIPFNKANFERKEFQELWSRINRKAVYHVAFDSNELTAKCVTALDKRLRVPPLQYVVESGQQAASADADDLSAGRAFAVGRSETLTESVTASSLVMYDLLGEISERTHLTRRTVAAILQGVQADTFAKYRQNPEQFITQVGKLVNEQKATVIVEHLTYDALDECHDSVIFTENQSKQDFTKATDKLRKHVYDYVVTDSKVEKEFVGQLETASEVVVYAKLPHGFLIPTPVGDYNPDWAIAFQQGSVKHVYFVAETKGSLSTMKLRGTESTKVECARKFFAGLAAEGTDVKYDVVIDYAQLMSLVGTS